MPRPRAAVDRQVAVFIVELQSNVVLKEPVKSPSPEAKSVRDGAMSGANGHPRPGLAGCLIINADDWGFDTHTTDRTLECFRQGVLSSASGMVFMQDSVRASNIATEHSLDIGLHLNLSAPFSTSCVPTRLEIHQQLVRKYLCKHPFTRAMYHPWLANSFEYVVAKQIEEFTRLYGKLPDRIDGHHHMHLSANVLVQQLLPSGTIVRRHFSYEPGEKIVRNFTFRMFSSVFLRRYRFTDFLFSLPPLSPAARMKRIFGVAKRFVVEVEAHPINPEEYQFLMGGDLLRWTAGERPSLAFSKALALQPA